MDFRAAQNPTAITGRLEYQTAPFSAELVRKLTAGPGSGPESGSGFDIISMLEVLEHVDSPRDFLQTACAPGVLKPGGSLLVSTLNRSPLAYTEAILAAENLLGKPVWKRHSAGSGWWVGVLCDRRLERGVDRAGIEFMVRGGIVCLPHCRYVATALR